MPSGIASPWGLSPPMVAGLDNSLDASDMHLTGQLSLTSTPVTYNGNTMLSPLTRQNASYYYKNPSNGSSFGSTLKSVKHDIRYLNKLKE